MIISNRLSASALALAAAVSMPLSAAQAEKISMNFGIIDNKGNCGVQLPFDNGKKLELNVRSKDGNLNVRVQNLPAALVNAAKDKANSPITLVFDGKEKVVVDEGYYSAGFYYELRGYWNDSADGAAALRAFKKAKNITVKFDGQTFGPVSTQAGSINMAWGMIASCVERNGGVMPGDDG
ncbi:MAG: hypothetical protein AB8B54_10845 [Sphingorhabdus sp.]